MNLRFTAWTFTGSYGGHCETGSRHAWRTDQDPPAWTCSRCFKAHPAKTVGTCAVCEKPVSLNPATGNAALHQLPDRSLCGGSGFAPQEDLGDEFGWC